MNLAKKISLSVLAVILFFGSLVTLLIFLFSRNILIENEKIALVKNTTNQAHELYQVFDHSSELVTNIADDPEVLLFLTGNKEINKDHLTDHFKVFNIGGRYSSIYLMDEQGNTLISTDESFVNQNYAFRSYFKNALKGNTVVEAAVGVTSGEIGYYFAQPVISDDNQIQGVVVAKLIPNLLHQLIRADSVNQGVNIFLTDQYGVIIYSNKSNDIYKSLSTLNESELQEINDEKLYSNINIVPLNYDEIYAQIKAYSSDITMEIYNNTDKERKIISLSKIGDAPFFLVVEENVNNFVAPAVSVAQTMATFVVAAPLVAAMIIFFIISRFMIPLTKLQEYTEVIAAGDYDKKIDIKSSDEIGLLAKSFNKMVLAIKNSRLQVDRQVKEQTQEIIEKQAFMEDQQKAVLNILEDVEDEKNKSQALASDMKKFKLAAENATDQIVITNADGIILFANKATTKITGFDQVDIIGKKAGSKELWGGFMGLDFYKKFWQAIKIDKQDFSGEFNNQRKNGEKYIAEAHVAPIVNDQDEVIFFVAIERDITKAKEVDRMKTEFISLASHQLRTPLSAMKWFLEMLLNKDMGVLNKEQLEAVTNINESNERMIDLVNGLLNVSRIETGRIIIDPKLTDLKELAISIIKELEPAIKTKNIKITLKASKTLPQIKIDPKLIREVYKNLLTNAIKYSPAKSAVELSILLKGKDIISQVGDHGFGIPKKDQAKIFKKFFRAENVVKRETDGTGLGLYLVKAILEASGGKIWFESEEGKGSNFYFTLPVTGSKSKKGEVSLDPA